MEFQCERLKQQITYKHKSSQKALNLLGPATHWVFCNLQVPDIWWIYKFLATLLLYVVYLDSSLCVSRESKLRVRVFTTAFQESLRGASSSGSSGGRCLEAEKFLSLMRRLEAFSGVRVLTYVADGQSFPSAL